MGLNFSRLSNVALSEFQSEAYASMGRLPRDAGSVNPKSALMTEYGRKDTLSFETKNLVHPQGKHDCLWALDAVSRTYEEHVDKSELRFDEDAVWIGRCFK
jgi:hypothetical protein